MRKQWRKAPPLWFLKAAELGYEPPEEQQKPMTYEEAKAFQAATGGRLDAMAQLMS